MDDDDNPQGTDLLASAKRVMRVARDLCRGDIADVISVDGYSVARSVVIDFDAHPTAPITELMRTGKSLWVEDTRASGREMVTEKAAVLRNFIGAPVMARDGSLIGALCVCGLEPRPFEERTLQRLEELAELVTAGMERELMVEQLRQTTADLTAALEAAHRSEQRLQLALELARVHVWEIDLTNPDHGSDRLPPLGAGVSPVQAKVDMWSAMHPADRGPAKALWKRHVAEGVPYEVDHRITRPDGPHIWLRAAARAVKGEDGRIQRIVGAYRNIDREKRSKLELVRARDDAEAANQAKSAFLATMSHEIRTPLNGVLGMAQVMATGPLDPEQRDRLDVVRQSGETLLAILNDILDLSKVEAGKLALEEVDFDIEQVAKAAHAAFSAVASSKGLSFEVAVAQGARGVYHGDPTRVRQILYNLVSNALKFTEAGGVRVSVGRGADGRLKLRVKDTGIGIAPDRADQLFQKFEQADASTTRRFGGTGLGLAICRELAGLMGGTITLKSAPGKGAAFTVDLPLTRVRAAPARPSAAAGCDAGEDFDGGPVRVLAAEDNAVNQAVLKALLNQIGIEPVIVDNGVDAVAAWEQGDWDVILMDVQMPRMDGPTATQFIRSREKTLRRRHTPIVALTANSMAHQVAEYLALGMDAFVPKPIEIARLFETLQAVLSAPAVEPAQTEPARARAG